MKTKNEKIKIKKKRFTTEVLKYLSGEEINSKLFFLAIHLAYAKCTGENLSKKKILIYHMHICWYLKRCCKDFKNIKTISMTRELKSNIPNRVVNSFEQVNTLHLNPTDQIFFKTRSYKNTIFEDFYTLDFLKKFVKNEHRVVKHEDLLTRKKSVIKNLCKYINIKYENILKKSTINRIQWNYKHPKKVKLKSGVASHITKYNKNNFFKYEMHWIDCLSLTYNRKYKYNYKKNFFFLNYFLTFLFIILPSKTELKLFLNCFKLNFIVDFLKKLFLEINTRKLILYENNAFYVHKWTNKYYPFKTINFLIKMKKNLSFFWISIYFFFKLFLFLVVPVFVIFEYLNRVLICYTVLIKILLNKRFFPNKL